MTEPRHRIVVALDLSEYAEIVLEHAIDQAARYRAPDLHFLHVTDGPERDVDAGKQALASLVLPALEDLDCSDWRVRLHVRTGKAADEIANLAGELAAQLIVLGRFGAHHRRRRLGSVAASVIDLVSCPTLVVGLGTETEGTVQCENCVAIRASSEGARWFCAQHTDDRVRLSTIVMPGTSWIGGLMW
jgi:nucleotide-binding universal stress UspA family protein